MVEPERLGWRVMVAVGGRAVIGRFSLNWGISDCIVYIHGPRSMMKILCTK